MVKVVDWNINDVIDTHQGHKNRRIKAIAKVLECKGRVDYKRFLAEMQYNGIRKSVAEGYLDVLTELKIVRIEKEDIVWNIKETEGSSD
jgi:hypothetical protein